MVGKRRTICDSRVRQGDIRSHYSSMRYLPWWQCLELWSYFFCGKGQNNSCRIVRHNVTAKHWMLSPCLLMHRLASQGIQVLITCRSCLIDTIIITHSACCCVAITAMQTLTIKKELFQVSERNAPEMVGRQHCFVNVTVKLVLFRSPS